MMASVKSFLSFFPNGFRTINGTVLNSLFNLITGSVEDGITATAGGTKALAYKLTATISRISVAANAGDSVLLPTPTYIGQVIQIINDGAQNVDIYGSNSDTIDAVATATGVVLSAASRALFTCTGVTVASPNPIYAWRSQAGAKSS